MNDIQCLIDRQLGFYCRLNYDNVLKRLVVLGEEYYGLQTAPAELAPLEHDPPIFACRFAEMRGYEHILALANEDGRVAIQDTSKVGDPSSLESFQCHNNAVFDLAWMPGDMNFVTVSGDHTACLWDLAEGVPRRVLTFSGHTKSVKTAVFRPTDPAVFATGARDGHILVWDIRANNRPALVLKPDNCLTSCHSSFAPKTPGSHGKRARIDAQRAVSVTGLAYRDDATLISCGECDGNIKAWDLRKNYNAYAREPLPKHSIPYCGSSTRNGYTNLIVDDARVRLYASCMDDVIYCFNVSTYNALPERRYTGHENRTFYIKTSLSPDGEYLVSGSSDTHAYVWSVRRARPLVRLAGHRAEVTCAAWRRAAPLALVTCSDDARHRLWRLGPEHLAGLDPLELRGRAEPVPRAEPAPPLDTERTPRSLKRAAPATPGTAGAKRPRPAPAASGRHPKRCLAELLEAAPDAGSPKRPRVEEPPPAAGSKRPRPAVEGPEPESPPARGFEKRSRRVLSPRSPRPIAADASARSPVKASPTKVRVISYPSPTRGLPDFVRTGEAPHLRLMSPAKKRATTDWLTALRERRVRAPDLGERSTPTAPPSPRGSSPAPRAPVPEKTPRSRKTGTLLKYFSVAGRGER